jgi:hypothetical protein
MRSIKFKGKDIKFKNDRELADKLKVTVKTATQYRQGKIGQVIIRDDIGTFAKVNIKDDGANEILNKFNIKKITNRELLTNTQLKRVIGFKERKITIDNKQLEGKNNYISDAQLKIYANVYFSTGEVKIMVAPFYNGKIGNIEKFAEKAVEKYIEKMTEAESYQIQDIKVMSVFSDQEFEYDKDNFVLEKEAPINITNVYNVELNKGIGCVNRMFREFTNYKPNFGDDVSRREIIKYCDNKIHLVIYGLGGVIYDNMYDSKHKLSFLDYGGHCYPLANGKLSKHKLKNIEDTVICNCDEKIIECLDKKLFPYEIKQKISKDDDNKILSFICENIKYINNNNYEKVKIYLDQFHIKDAKIKDNCDLGLIYDELCKKYQCDYKSFFPVTFIKGNFNYAKKANTKKQIVGIDKNKCFAYILKNLSYILTCDYRTATINERPDTIKEDYLYIAEAEKSDDICEELLINELNIYTGKRIIKAAKYLERINVYCEISTKVNDNKYIDVINDLYNKLPEKDFKEVAVIAIGKMAQNDEVRNKTEVVGIFNNEEIGIYEGNKIKIGNNHTMILNIIKDNLLTNEYSNKPINIQIKDECCMMVYDKIKSLGIKSKDIVRIKTDAIFYYGELPDDLNKDFDGWKEEKYTESNEINCRSGCNTNPKTFYIKEDNNNILYNCNAGWGKTYNIVNKLIKKLDDYIIITPSHKTCECYKKENINCCVVHRYIYNNELPKEKNIIIDEIGLFNKEGHDFIYKCYRMGKRIIAYGDFNQLPPVEDEKDMGYFNSKQYIDMIFSKQITTFKNYRNNFKKDYYDDLINDKLDNIEEIRKYSTKSCEDAEIIICYTNAEVDKYNKLMMSKLKLKNDSIGLKVICKKNDLGYKHIYNGFEFKITNNDYGKITLNDTVTVTKKQFERCFKPYYASTLYGYQGLECESYYFPESQEKYIKSGKFAYTLISRLKQKLVVEPKEDIETDKRLLISFDSW